MCTFSIPERQKGSKPSVFDTFDLEMCFAPQRRALFRHAHFKEWSETVSFLHFWLGKGASRHNGVHFSTAQLPKVVRAWCVLYILTGKCASRHNSVQLFISHLASWLRTRRFSEPTLRPSRATNHWKKHSEPRLSYLFVHLHLLSSHSFSSLIFLLLFFSSLTLPTSAIPSVHIVGSLIFKLPSTSILISISWVAECEIEWAIRPMLCWRGEGM